MDVLFIPRNAIIHDYLNIDWSKLELELELEFVLAQRRYHDINTYIAQVLKKLLI